MSYDALRAYAEIYEDVQKTRIRTWNRVSAYSRGSHAQPIDEDALRLQTEAVEKMISKQLVDDFKLNVPESVQIWVNTTPGLGIPSVARLLGIIGDPRLAEPLQTMERKTAVANNYEIVREFKEGSSKVLVAEEPYARSVSQLWSYCGYGDPARTGRQAGITQDELLAAGKPRAKMMTYVIASNCVKTKGPYRDVYDKARETYATRVHAEDHPRCGKKTGLKGTPWTPGHQHAAAIRKMCKEILRDLWVATPEPVVN